MPARRSPNLGHHIAPPRFIAFILISIVGYAFAQLRAQWPHAVLIGFDLGGVTFLISCVPLFNNATDDMREAARRNDANRVTLLAVTGIVCAVLLVAIGVELAQKAKMDAASIALIIGTLLVAWLFSNLIYALHYAHLFYRRSPADDGDHGGIDFCGEDDPDYWDFIYFAFTLGMTFQTSDLNISSRAIRRVVIFHCFAAFVFNIGVLAFTINILGG